MSSVTLESIASGPVTGDERVRLLANMAEALHAIAQPLTILRSSVAAAATVGIDPIKQRRYLELSTQQVERLCSQFECIQDLVIASQTQAECAPIELSGLLAAVVRDKQAELKTSGIELRVVIPGSLPAVLGDATRTLQALLAGLKMAASVSIAGDEVDLLANAGNGYLDLVVRSGRTRGRSLNSSERLGLFLAEMNILSQQGKYECTDDPFRVVLRLPLQNVEGANRASDGTDA